MFPDRGLGEKKAPAAENPRRRLSWAVGREKAHFVPEVAGKVR
jgi:hypothetical protein